MRDPKSKVQNRKPDNALEFISSSVDRTQAFGERLGALLSAGDVVALHGALGSGKTTLIQGIARALGRDPDEIKSPTFVLMREYAGSAPIVHIDGYRLEGAPAISWLDLDLIFSPRKITLIEWAERFADLLPENYLEIQLTHLSANRRRLFLLPHGPGATVLIGRLRDSSAGKAEGPTQDAPSSCAQPSASAGIDADSGD